MVVDVDEGLDFSEDNNESSEKDASNEHTLPMNVMLPLGSNPHRGIPG